MDSARCDGVGSDQDGWRDGCDTCLRRTSKGDSEYQVYITPPAIIVFCPFLIKPESYTNQIHL